MGDLIDLLQRHGVNTSLYGRGTTRTLSQLFKEIVEGESTLLVDNGVLTRHLIVLLLHIRRSDGKVLTELKQTFHATSEREEYSTNRLIPLAEKMTPGEDVTTAVTRALSEELGVDVEDVTPLLLERVTETKVSHAYPGMLSSFDTIRVEITEESTGRVIPEGYTYTEHYANGQPRVTAVWGWM